MSNSGPTDDVGTLRNELEQSRRLLESQADYSRRLRAEFYKNSPLTWRRSFPLALFAAIKAAQLINFARRPKGLRKPLWAAIAEIPEAIALGSENLRARSRRPAVALGLTWYDYDNWVRLFDTPTPTDLWRLGTAATGAEDCPEITIVIPAYESDEKYLSVALDSLRSQSYPHWRAIVVDDGSSNAVASAVLSKYAALDRRIAHFRREKNSGIAAATNAGLEKVVTPWVGFMDHDDELAPHALAVVVLYMAQNPQWRLIYSDEDKITATGERYYPSFKRDFDPLLLLGQNYINHFSVVSTELLTAVGGLRSEFDGAQDWDMWLRLTEKVGRAEIGHIPHVLYHWRAGEGSAALSSDGKPMAATAGERAVKEAISRGGYTATVGTTEHPGHLLVNFVPKSTPLVDIVIPTRDGAMLGRCLESLICTTYPNYRVTVIDNGSIKTSTKRTLAKYPGVGVVRDPSPFNYSAMHNRVVPALSGEFLVMLNDDTEVIEPSWLTTMVGLATGYGAGIVGAKLLYPDNTIQHAGVVITPSGARHILSREPSSTGGYRGQAICAQEFSAVTGACLMVRRELYLGLGGMNEELVVAFNDVDLCLRARERGEIVAWHPGVLLYHHESLSRGKEHTPDSFVRGHKESEILKSRHLGIFQRDPYYNTNLTDSDPTYELCWPPRLSPWVLST